MSAPNSEEVSTSMTGDETLSLGSHEVEDVGNATAISSVPLRSEEPTRHFKVATDPLIQQVEKLSHLMKELRRDTSRPSEEASGLVQCPS